MADPFFLITSVVLTVGDHKNLNLFEQKPPPRIQAILTTPGFSRMALVHAGCAFGDDIEK
jgi:hypothetical protein